MAQAAACHRATAGCLITVGRGGYDSVMLNESANLGLASARSAVQAYALKQSLQDPNTHLVWVASDWNLADALTKTAPEARRPLEQFLRLRKWRVRFDPEFIVAAKKANKTARQVMNDETENLDADEDLGLCGTQWQEEFWPTNGRRPRPGGGATTRDAAVIGLCLRWEASLRNWFFDTTPIAIRLRYDFNHGSINV